MAVRAVRGIRGGLNVCISDTCLFAGCLLQDGKRRMKGVSLTLPVVTGTIAFYLGKKVRQWWGGVGGRRNAELRLGSVCCR